MVRAGSGHGGAKRNKGYDDLMEKERIQGLEKQMKEFEMEIAPVFLMYELEKQKQYILKLINSLKGHDAPRKDNLIH